MRCFRMAQAAALALLMCPAYASSGEPRWTIKPGGGSGTSNTTTTPSSGELAWWQRLQVNPVVSLGDIATALGFPVALFLFLHTRKQIRDDSRRDSLQSEADSLQRRAEFGVNFVFKFLEDKDATDMLYKLDHNKFKYDESTFPGSRDEIKLDKLIYHFEKLAFLLKLGAISFEEVLLVKYEILNVYDDPEVQKYFKFLDRTAATKDNNGTYPGSRDLAEKLREKRMGGKPEGNFRSLGKRSAAVPSARDAPEEEVPTPEQVKPKAEKLPQLAAEELSSSQGLHDVDRDS